MIYPSSNAERTEVWCFLEVKSNSNQKVLVTGCSGVRSEVVMTCVHMLGIGRVIKSVDLSKK